MSHIIQKLFPQTATALRSFATSESGIVTTDWIVLTGVIMGVSLSATVAVRTGVSDLALGIDTSLTGAQVASVMAPALAAPLRWMKTETWAHAGTKCPPAPDLCPNYKPAQTWDSAILKLEDGTLIERLTITSFPDGSKPIVEVEWRDADGKQIEGPTQPPELDMKALTCDKTGVCTAPVLPSKK